MPVVDCWNFAQHPNVPEKPTMDVQNPVGFLKEKYHPGAFGLDNLKNEGIYRP